MRIQRLRLVCMELKLLALANIKSCDICIEAVKERRRGEPIPPPDRRAPYAEWDEKAVVKEDDGDLGEEHAYSGDYFDVVEELHMARCQCSDVWVSHHCVVWSDSKEMKYQPW